MLKDVIACYLTVIYINPSLPQLVNFQGWKVHTDTPANSIFDGPITTLLLILCILVEVLSRAQAKGGEVLILSNFGTSIGCFSSDGAASTAVKGLRKCVNK